MGETAYILVKDLFFLEFKDTKKTAILVPLTAIYNLYDFILIFP